jgi:hypothetical protein
MPPRPVALSSHNDSALHKHFSSYSVADRVDTDVDAGEQARQQPVQVIISGFPVTASNDRIGSYLRNYATVLHCHVRAVNINNRGRMLVAFVQVPSQAEGAQLLASVKDKVFDSSYRELSLVLKGHFDRD